MAVGFLFYEIRTISLGKTPYELKKKLSLKNTESFGERMVSVFGSYWFINFIFPAEILFKQKGDGTTWDKLKFFYQHRDLDNSKDAKDQVHSTEIGSKSRDDIHFRRIIKQYVVKMENNQVTCDFQKQPEINIIRI